MNQTMIKAVMAGIFFFLIGLVITSPKGELFFKLQSKVSEEKIVLASKDTSNYFVFLKTNDSKLSSDSNSLLDFEDGYFFASYIYNVFYIPKPKLSVAMATILPIEPSSIIITNSLFAPTIVNITIKGDFGSIKTTLNTSDGKIKSILNMSSKLEQDDSMRNTKNMLLSKFKQTEEGLVYESNI
jgi:hypothetical protein